MHSIHSDVRENKFPELNAIMRCNRLVEDGSSSQLEQDKMLFIKQLNLMKNGLRFNSRYQPLIKTQNDKQFVFNGC